MVGHLALTRQQADRTAAHIVVHDHKLNLRFPFGGEPTATSLGWFIDDILHGRGVPGARRRPAAAAAAVGGAEAAQGGRRHLHVARRGAVVAVVITHAWAPLHRRFMEAMARSQRPLADAADDGDADATALLGRFRWAWIDHQHNTIPDLPDALSQEKYVIVRWYPRRRAAAQRTRAGEVARRPRREGPRRRRRDRRVRQGALDADDAKEGAAAAAGGGGGEEGGKKKKVPARKKPKKPKQPAAEDEDD